MTGACGVASGSRTLHGEGKSGAAYCIRIGSGIGITVAKGAGFRRYNNTSDSGPTSQRCTRWSR
jgi:hypothetical protein